MKKALSSLLISILALLAPGLEAYAAASTVVRGVPAGKGAPVNFSVNPVQKGFNPVFAGSGVPTLTPNLKPGAKINAQAGLPILDVSVGNAGLNQAELGGVEAAVNPLGRTAELGAGISGPFSSLDNVQEIAGRLSEDQAARSGGQEAVLHRTYDGEALKAGSAGFVNLKAEAANASSKRSSLRKSQKKMPDSHDDPEGGEQTGPIDDLGNPSRKQTPGPDDRNDDGEGSRDGGGQLFGGIAALGLAAGFGFTAPAAVTLVPAILLGWLGFKSMKTHPGRSKVLFVAAVAAAVIPGLVNIPFALLTLSVTIPSLILHEMAHAKAAARYGDQTAVMESRLSFKPRDLATHIHPGFTLLMPFLSLVTFGGLLGMARPVNVNPWNLANPVKDQAKVALAGPLTNFALAAVAGLAWSFFGPVGVASVLGAGVVYLVYRAIMDGEESLIYTALLLAGVGAAVLLFAPAALALTILKLFVFMNLFLGIFNLLPVAPLDGSHILLALLPAQASARVASMFDQIERAGLQWVLVMGVVIALAPVIIGAAMGGTTLLLGAGVVAAGAQTAVSFMPAAAVLGMLMNAGDGAGPKKLGAVNSPSGSAVNSTANGARSDVIVIFDGAQRPLALDLHLSDVNTSAPNGVEAYYGKLQTIQKEVGAAGLEAAVLEEYNVTPVASYRRINAATLQVDAARAEEFKQLLRSRGFRVYDNERREIVKPIPADPESMNPEARGVVGMEDNLRLTNTSELIEEGLRRWGPADMGWLRKLFTKFIVATAPQPLVGVIDTGVDLAHPLLKRVKDAKDVGGSQGKDDNGHGTWVASMILNYAPWLKSLTSYKAFTNGGATLDDILKSLTMAGNDGNIIISNSWGSNSGDIKSPDSELVRKLAEEGHIMVFARGNAGPRPDTLGSPGNSQYFAADGTPRILSIGSRLGENNSRFTSRGKKAPATKNDPSAPEGPVGVSGPGQNTEAAWPTTGRGADRVDPKLGPLKAISGTSMITPAVAGAIALLCMLFGVTKRGAELDRIVKAVWDTRVKDAATDGPQDGRIDVKAAYESLKATMKPRLAWLVDPLSRMYP